MALVRIDKSFNDKAPVPTSLPSYEGGEEKNKGGLIGGVGYLGEKVAVGAVQSIEGIFDYTLGGVAKLFGFDKFAERQFANDWFGDWYDHPDEWFNPGKGWQVAGDIAGGIGTSLPTLAVGLGTGGAGLAMFGVAGLSAAGNATKEAYRETGKLGGREFAYGAMTGALEGSLETITNLVGMGTGAVIKSFGKSLGKEFTESALRQGVGITLAKAFGGEAVEEGVAEIMSSRFKRWTYDSDAEHASAGQVLYASFVGGMSGVIMGGAGTVFSTAQNISRGTQLVEAGQADAVIEHAKYISEKAKKGGIEVGAIKQVEATYNKLVKSLEKTGGEVKTVAQRQMLGELKIDNIAAELSPPMYKTVAAIAKDPDTFVEKLNAYGYTDSNGNVRTVTKEQLMKGLDVNNLKGTIPTALETNETLRDIVLMSMAGEMMINTSKFQESILRGEKFAGDADLENFLRVASPDEVKSVEKLFGIKDLRTVDAETFNERVAAFQASGQYDEYLARYNAEKTASAEAVNAKKAEKTASTDTINADKNANIEQNTANPTEESAVENERRALPKGAETEQNTSASSDGDVMMTLVDSMKFAKENVPEYKSLNADDQAKIRRLIRQAKANGFTDAQTRAYARVSARSGIDIVIGKEGLLIGKTETGADKYADGVYSYERNKIIINPEGTRSPARVLMHELTHAIYKTEEIGKDGKRKIKLILEEGAKKLSDDEKTRIIAKYFKNKKFDPVEYTDELNAHYTEAMLDDEALLEKLCEDNPTLPDKILSFFKKAITGYSDEPTLSREAKKLYKRYKTLFEMFAEKNQYASPEEARMSGKVDDSRFSLQYAPDIAENQREYLKSHKKATITEDELKMAINQTADLVSLMSPFKDILPKDIRGKTLVKNGSYDISVENTTICIRTLSYNSFTDKVAEKIGRPLTQMESFLVSQKLYEIAKEPQCLYCYVSLDRKAYNEMLLRYINERDSAVENYKKAGMPDVSSISVDKINSAKEKGTTDKLDEASKLFLGFLGNRKVTKNMLDRYKSWMSIAKQGGKFLSTEAVATEAQRKALIEGKESPLKEQAKDMFKYAQSASWAKKQTDYVAYYNDILKLSDAVVKNLNKHYGLRWYSFSDYSAAFIVENMQQITDAAIRGLKGLAYTKDTDFVKIFAPTGMNINVSVYATKDANGNYYIDEKQSANLKEAIALREKYENVGIVVVATDNAGVEWALSQKWSDVVIPFHTVRTGADVAAFYDWTVFNNEQSDTIGDENLWNAYVESVTNGDAKKSKKVSKMVYPSEHQNNRDEYLRICKERGIKPRFSSFLDNPNYMKLVNETRQSESATQPLQAKFDTEEAKKSFKKFEEKGGYYEGWYNDGIDVDGEAEIVAKDIAKGLKPDEVEYSVKGFDAKKAMEKRKTNRQHGDRMALPDEDIDNVGDEGYNKVSSEYDAIFAYKSSESYKINEVLRNNYELSDSDVKLIKRLDKQLKEIPTYEGVVYRNLSFDFSGQKALDDFVAMHVPGEYITYPAYTSTSKSSDGYPIDAELAVHMKIYGINGHDISKNYGIETEKEVLFERNSSFYIRSVSYDGKTANILMEEDYYEQGRVQSGDTWDISGEQRSPDSDNKASAMQQMQALAQGKSQGSMQGVPEWDTKRDISQRSGPQKTLRGGQRSEVRTESGINDKNHSNDRYALPDEEGDSLDMSSSVGKKRSEYKASFKERVFTAADSVYIDTVDEYYGAEKYLRKIGKKKNAASILQAIRASMSAAQVMIGDVQKDIFSEDGKTLGEGLSKIVKPITVKGDTIKRTFNEYLMHHLNVDRMSLEEKSLAQLEEMKAKLEDDAQKVREFNKKIAELKDKKKSIFSDEEAQKQIDQRIAKYQKEAEALKNDILEQKKQIDNFGVLKNKPIFGENESRAEAITAEQSLKRIAELEKVHPDFREIAEKVWAYTKNLNHMRVEAGLISAESEAYMNELYPHYVPAYRDTKGGGASAIRGRRNLAISSTVKSAKGSGLDILDVMDSIAAQTQEVIRAGRINQLFRAIYDTAMLGNGTEYVEIVSRQKVSGKQVADESAEGEMPSTIELRPKNNQVTGFVNGEKVTLSVSDEIFIAFDSMSKPTVDPTSAIGKGLQKLNDIYKRLITSWSPAFLLRNPIRDIQDAGLNSKHPIEFARNLVKVYKMMLENSEEWQTYRAYGGYSASIFGQDGFSADVDSRGFEAMAKLFDTDAPTMKDFFEAAKRGGKNLLTGINNVNAFVEQATRFAEYLASVEAGESIPNAINNAAEVTTNFGRRGRVTKVLNATIMPFLNPAIQGFDKMFRNVGDAFKEGSGAAIAKALGVLFAKAAAIGLAPMVINMLMYGDDDDYKLLREEDKENNFLIKVGDTFIKIPRGRVASVIGGTANRASKLAKGEDADLKGYAENVLSQVTPVGNLTRTIFSPFFDVKNNRTWYGTEIEGRQWDNTAPKDRYDESTSSIAVAIGKVTNYSPKKIHYLLDQYSGVIGDFVLPATSKKASKDFFSGNFTIDAATSNKLSSQFYEMYDRAQYAKTAGDDTAIYQVKYLNSVKDAVSKLHDEKQAIQNDSELSNVEKLQKSRVVQILINEAYKTALTDIERYTQAFEATAGIEKTATFQGAFGTSATDATIQKMRYTEATRYMYGAKKALEEYDDKVYEKCELLNSAGVDYDKLYYYYFSTKGLTSDVDKKGNTVSGSKRKKVVATINALDIPSVQKALLICAQGYTLQSGDVKGVTEKKLLSYILKLNTSKQVKENLAKLCGFEVKNGKIVIK